MLDLCSEHECTRTAPGGYCIEPRCYCGSCPWWKSIDEQATNTPDAYTAVDRAAIASSTGRRTGTLAYRQAREVRDQRNRRPR